MQFKHWTILLIFTILFNYRSAEKEFSPKRRPFRVHHNFCIRNKGGKMLLFVCARQNHLRHVVNNFPLERLRLIFINVGLWWRKGKIAHFSCQNKKPYDFRFANNSYRTTPYVPLIHSRYTVWASMAGGSSLSQFVLGTWFYTTRRSSPFTSLSNHLTAGSARAKAILHCAIAESRSVLRSCKNIRTVCQINVNYI